MITTDLKIQRNGPCATVVLCNTAKRNAISTDTAQELTARLKELDQDPEVRAIILTGEGSVFSSGGDLDEFLSTVDAGGTALWESGAVWQSLFETIPSLSKPTIARVVGPAMAGACGLVAACDFSYCSEDAKFGSPEIKIGLFPLFILPALIRRLGERHAMDLSLTGRTINAQEAYRIGLVNDVFTVEELDEKIQKTVDALVKTEPATMRRGKHAFYQISQAGFVQGLELARGLRPAFMCSEELRKGIEKFFAKKAG